MTTETAPPVPAPRTPRTLSQEERNDLRMKVLRREPLSLDEARDVFETLRQKHVEVTIEGEKPRKRRSPKASMSDEDLDASLDKLL